MTPFTDDDLKRLKEILSKDIGNLYYRENRENDPMYLVPIDFDALFARLEAAENLIDVLQFLDFESQPGRLDSDVQHEREKKAFDIWCKAAGK